MAENIARDTQYQYKATASLVLQQDRSHIPNRTKEPTGEPESLWGIYDPKQMGDRAQRAQPEHELSQMAKQKQKAERSNNGAGASGLVKKQQQKISARERITSAFGAQSVLDAVDDFEGLTYRPKTRETKETYSLILHFTAGLLGDQSQEILRSATDEVLATLKNATLKDFDKKKEIEYIIGEQLAPEKFNQLINLGKKITDYSDDSAQADKAKTAEGEIDEDVGVAVVFDEEEEEASDVYEINEDEESDEEPGIDEAGEADLAALNEQKAEDSAEVAAAMDEEETVVPPTGDAVKSRKKAAGPGDNLSPLEIDAFWLQRTVSTYFPDALTSQKISNQIMDILRDTRSARECENALVQLLNYSNFELVKLATKHKDLIYWSTRLAKAGPRGEERTAVEKEVADAGFSWILVALQTGASSVRDDMEVDQEEPRKRQQTMAEKIASRAPHKLLDLDAMAFAQGSHVMTNKKCELPAGSFKTTHKSYEEVTVPAPTPPAMADGETLVSITLLPEWAQPAFKSAKCLNRVQSRVYPAAFETDENLLICAPTGAGKTNVAVLTMLRAISRFRNVETGRIDLDALKIIYIAPMKALVQEVVGNFSARLGAAYGIKVAELTGDRQLTKQQIAETQIIVTTPEKWDIITRKAHDRSYTQLVRLIIIDEIHLLHDDRGPVLEAIVARTVRGIEASSKHVRLVGLSATLPNYHDVAAFLRVDRHQGLFHFDNGYRPCPLRQTYIGITERKVHRRLQLMNEICYEKCHAEAGRNQVLVFVHSRKETGKTARAIRDLAIQHETLPQFLRHGSASSEILAAEAETAKSKELQELLPYGFACHHAGMTRADRTLVEELFADGHIQVLVSTATLAWGVNLPAHTVIIKGTQVYQPDKGRWQELSPQDVLQMLGRAGRPQYDTHGEGIIITAHQELQFYLSLLNVQLPIESQLVGRLPDMLNAEIVLGTVRSRDDACEWLAATYLYIRALRAPNVYGVDDNDADNDSDKLLMQWRVDLVHAAAVLLDRAQLIKYDKKASGRMQVTELGRIAAHFYLSHRSVATYNRHLRPAMGMIELLRVFSLSDEFRHIPVRQEEQMELQTLVERVPIPVKEAGAGISGGASGAAEEPASKINVLLQAYISQLKLTGFALVSDMVYVTQSAGRILRAIFEICLRRGWAQLARQALSLCQMVERRMWLSMTPLRQFRGVSMDLMRRLEKKEFPWERMRDLNAQELGELVRNPKAGKLLQTLVRRFPRLELQARVLPVTRSTLSVDLTITPAFEYCSGSATGDAQDSTAAVHSSSGELFWLLVEDCDQERILHCDQFVLRPRYATDEHHVSFTVPLHEPLPPNYFVSVVSDRWMHAETRLPVSFKHLILPAAFPPHTELLDMQPLPCQEALRDTEAHRQLFARRGWRYFNAVQTQLFDAVYNRDDNVFVGAPGGSGKSVCAELAMLRLWAAADDAVAVYIAPSAELCTQRRLQWSRDPQRRLTDAPMHRRIVQLTGESAVADLKRMDGAHLVLATPQQWDMVSRRWRQRAAVQRVRLFIVDQAHQLGAQVGPTMEIVVSRMRFMSSQLAVEDSGDAAPVRIVALSASLGNARDIGEWIGCSGAATVFNFHPSVRPVPMEIHMQSFNIPHMASLMLAMAKPVFTGVVQHCPQPQHQAMVFVPGRRHTRDTATELIALSAVPSATDPVTRRFLRLPDGQHISADDEDEVVDRAVHSAIGHVLDTVSDAHLRLALSHGIGYLNEGQSPEERRVVTRLYQQGVVRVLLVSREMMDSLYDEASGRALDAHMVVIMGTQYYNGHEHRYVDYALAEVLQMTACAGRRDSAQSGNDHDDEDDSSGMAAPVLFMCPTNKKEFYKKFLYEGLPIESHLDHSLHDHFNAEIVTKTIETKQDAVDYLTWTYMYRRMAQNPNYYNLIGVTHRHLSDHLSELVESTIADLAASKCIEVADDELGVSPLNLGMIAAYYYINYLTIEVLSMSLTSSTKLRGLLEVVTSAAEFEPIPIRHHEDVLLGRIYDKCPVKFSAKPNFADPHVKANLLVQSHFSRLQLPPELMADLNDKILGKIIPLIYASVDVLSSSGWLYPAMAAMELCQMVVQAMWGDRESPLRQLPFFDQKRIELAKEHSVETVFDFIELEDESVRNAILVGLTGAQIGEVAKVVNRYPNIDVEFSLGTDGAADQESTTDDGLKSIAVTTSDGITISVQLNRDMGDEEDEDDGANAAVGPVCAPFFPVPKEEGWWLVVGDPQTKQLLSIKRVGLQRRFQCKLDFAAPEQPGTHRLKLFFMCDSWVGCDQEYEFEVQVEQGMDVDDDADA